VTTYEDPDRPATLENRFSMNDLQRIARESCQQLVSKASFEGTERPMVFLATLQNETSEHIDMQSVADAIQSALLESGKFRFTAGSQGQKAIQEQIDFQAVAASPETRAQMGRQVGARYIMYGRLAEFTQREGGKHLVDYQFTLRAANCETGEVLVATLSRLRKVTTNASVGW
jgi:uncharacterized protein (TIGR02722 family)